MSPAAGGAAPAQSAPAIAAPEPDRAAARRDPMGLTERSDATNAVAKKPAWIVRAPAPEAAAAPSGGIIGGDASWPALVESTRACAKSTSSDSLKSLSDGSGPSTKEDPIAPSVPPPSDVEVTLMSDGSNPTSTPVNAAVAASSQQNGTTAQPNPVRRSGSNGGNGSTGGRRSANSSGGDGSRGSGGGGQSNRSLGSDSSLSDSTPAAGTSGTGNGSIRNNNRNDNISGVDDSTSNNIVSTNGNNSSGGSSSRGGNSTRHGSGTSNGIGGRGGYRSRRDHERGGNFSPRNYQRVSVMPYQQQHQPGVFQPASFHRPSTTPAAHFMVPQHFVPYVPPFPYHGDVQPYPLYPSPIEQFQNMHLVRPPMQSSWVPQDQPSLHEDIRTQIEFYFSTNNLCHDTFLRRHMNDQGWVPINLILGFNRMRRFTGLVDTNYILDAIRGSEILEVQGNNVRRRNDWADWLLH